MKLEDAIKQNSFRSEFEKAYINVQFTANVMHADFSRDLKKYGISPQQFNILRILRGQFPKAAPLKLITERMIDKMSNTSRLVEKLRAKGLVDRHINSVNRREVAILITPKGLELISEASKMVDDMMTKKKVLTEEESRELNRLLEKILA